MDLGDVDKALEHQWYWKAVGRYEYWAVDAYDRKGGTGTVGSAAPSSTFTKGRAEEVANYLNGTYKEGINRGRAEVIKYLLDNGEQELAEMIMYSGSFDSVD